jgi:hypothetical protein
MAIIDDLKKEKIMMASKNPIRSSFLSVIISDAANIAKKDLRDIVDLDITKSIINLISKNEESLKILTCQDDIDILKEEIAIGNELLSILPEIPKIVYLTKDETLNIIKDKFNESELVKSNMKNIMGYLKTVPNINAGLAAELVKGLLK